MNQPHTNLHNLQIGYMRLPAILELLPIGKSTWWAGVKKGKFPKPVKLGPMTTAWLKADIMELLEKLQRR